MRPLPIEPQCPSRPVYLEPAIPRAFCCSSAPCLQPLVCNPTKAVCMRSCFGAHVCVCVCVCVQLFLTAVPHLSTAFICYERSHLFWLSVPVHKIRCACRLTLMCMQAHECLRVCVYVCTCILMHVLCLYACFPSHYFRSTFFGIISFSARIILWPEDTGM